MTSFLLHEGVPQPSMFPDEVSSNLTQGFKIGCSKVVLGTIWGYYTKTVILHRFMTKQILEIALPWQYLGSQVIKNYLKGCVIR